MKTLEQQQQQKISTYLRLNIPLNVMDPQPLDMAMFLDKAYWEMVKRLNLLKRRPLQTMKTPNRPVYNWRVQGTQMEKTNVSARNKNGNCLQKFPWLLFFRMSSPNRYFSSPSIAPYARQVSPLGIFSHLIWRWVCYLTINFHRNIGDARIKC